MDKRELWNLKGKGGRPTGHIMAKPFPYSHFCHGQVVGFSVKHFGSALTFVVCFTSLDGRRLKRDTNQSRIGQAVEAARIIIEKEFAPAPTHPDKVTWDQAVERLKSALWPPRAIAKTSAIT